MISTVIPARLEFSCGHAALVSLPRLKGESAAQRTERVKSEKYGARGRACDFCGPSEPVRAVAVTGHHAVQEQTPTNGQQRSEAPSAIRPVRLSATPPPAAPAEPVALAATTHPLAPALSLVQPASPVVTAAVEAATPVSPVSQKPVAVVREPARRAEAAVRPTRVYRKRTPPAVAPAPQQRFRVRFSVEAVVPARTARDALRHVESLGATDVLSIVLAGR